MISAWFIIINSCSMQYFIQKNKCTGCGACLEVCPTEAIKMQEERAVITMECIDCGACPRVCPEGAIKQVLPTAVQNSE
jgi:ferredoxin